MWGKALSGGEPTLLCFAGEGRPSTNFRALRSKPWMAGLRRPKQKCAVDFILLPMGPSPATARVQLPSPIGKRSNDQAALWSPAELRRESRG